MRNPFRLLAREFVRWTCTTPRRQLGRCGRHVVIAPPFEATSPERVFLEDHVYIGWYAFVGSQGDGGRGLTPMAA